MHILIHYSYLPDHYVVRLADGGGGEIVIGTYANAREALDKIDELRAQGHTISEAELNKIVLA